MPHAAASKEDTLASADARYMALAADDLSRRYTFRLFADGSGSGVGADGATHSRFRTWKESLRDAVG